MNSFQTYRQPLVSALILSTLLGVAPIASAAPAVGTLEEVAELPIRPGNVTATRGGRIFATVHPLDKPSGQQLIEITGARTYQAWPSAGIQRGSQGNPDEQLDTPLGVYQDNVGRLWVTDMGLNIGKTRIWAFDVASGKTLHQIVLPQDVAPKGAFVQDLAVDAERGWVYLADIAPPGLIAVEIATGKARRFDGHSSLHAEASASMQIDGKAVMFHGKPVSIGVNPLTLSRDGKTLYFGAMSGKTWYSVPTQVLREGNRDGFAASVRPVGKKPVSDGAATDDIGNHFFTNLNENGIDKLSPKGKLTPLVRDRRLHWADNAQFGPEGWLYISVNQLHLTPAFTGGEDLGQAPYRIMRVWTGTPGNARKPR